MLTASAAGTYGQAQLCATHLSALPEVEPEVYEAYARAWQMRRSMPQIDLAITIHVVEEVQGAANIDIDQLYAELDAVNGFFANTGFQFFFCGSPRHIQGGRRIYTFQQAADELNRPHHVPNTINVFYLDEIGDIALGNLACGIATFPFGGTTPQTRFILMQKGCSTNGSTLAHEIGHFFGLLHTHETAAGIEMVNGTNCAIAGDFICDTPADPNLSLTGLSGCSFVAALTDINGDLYRPDPGNIMSYAPAACRRRFTNEQAIRMRFWYETELSYLLSSCDFYPDLTINLEQKSWTLPAGATIDLDFELGWTGISEPLSVSLEISIQSVNDATAFILHRDMVAFPDGSGERRLTVPLPIPLSRSSGMHRIAVVLDPSGTLIELDKRNNIVFIDLSVDNSMLAEAVLFPNPAQDWIRIFLRSRTKSGALSLQISDLYGRQYGVVENTKSQEEFFVEIPVVHLQPGAYILTVSFRFGSSQSFLFLKH